MGEEQPNRTTGDDPGRAATDDRSVGDRPDRAVPGDGWDEDRAVAEHGPADEVEYPRGDEEAGTALPRRVESWRRRSATGAMLTGFAFGLREILEPEHHEPAIVLETSGLPPKDLPVEADLDNLPPRQSVVKIRRWLLPESSESGEARAEPSESGQARAEPSESGRASAERSGGMSGANLDPSDGPSEAGPAAGAPGAGRAGLRPEIAAGAEGTSEDAVALPARTTEIRSRKRRSTRFGRSKGSH